MFRMVCHKFVGIERGKIPIVQLLPCLYSDGRFRLGMQQVFVRSADSFHATDLSYLSNFVFHYIFLVLLWVSNDELSESDPLLKV